MKRSSLSVLALTLAAVAVLLGSCTANGGAIFATIEQEVKTVGSNLPDTATVLTVLGVPPASSTYIAVSPTLYLGLEDPDAADDDVLTWKAIESRFPVAGGGHAAAAGSVCRSARYASDDLLYAVFSVPSDGGETVALYRADTSALPTSAAGVTADSVVPLDWDVVSPNLSGQAPVSLLLANDELFVAARKTVFPPTYALWHVDVGTLTATSELPGAAVVQSPVTDGDFDGTSYWFIAGNRIFSGALGAVAEYTNAAVSSTLGYGGIHYDAGTALLYLSSREGKLFALQGTTWTSTASALLDTNDDALPFWDYLSIDSTGPGVDVYVGSQGSGFYKLDSNGILAQSDLAGARMPDRTISELYGGTVMSFSRVGNVVFLCTAGAGLWHQTLPADLVPSGTAWRWE